MRDYRTFIVVLSGASGTGKSTLAARLATTYGWPVLAKDQIKETLLDTLGTGDRAWSRRLSDASFELLFALAAQWCGCTPVLVLDANFRPDVHGKRLSDLASRRGAGLLQVLLHAGRETLRSRFMLRTEAGALGGTGLRRRQVYHRVAAALRLDTAGGAAVRSGSVNQTQFLVR